MNYYTLLFFIFLNISYLTNKAESLNTEHIMGGHQLESGQMNYLVSVQINNHHRCGGGLIRDDMVLSAANCLIDEKSGQLIHARFSVLFSANAVSPSANSQRIDVQKAYLHVLYRPDVVNPMAIYTTQADIVLLELTSAFDIVNIHVLKIPLKFKSSRKTYIIAGYGAHALNVTRDVITGQNLRYKVYDGTLRYSKTKLLSTTACKRMYEFLHISKFCGSVVRNPTNISQGTCTGDGGSPLVYHGVLFGILTSGTSECDETTLPSIYTRVTYYRFFINRVLQGKLNEPEIRILTLKKTAFFGYIFYEAEKNVSRNNLSST